MSMKNPPTSAKMKPKKLTVAKKVDAGKAAPVKKKQSSKVTGKLPKGTNLKGNAYRNG